MRYDPRDTQVQIGPVIDGAAKAILNAHIALMRSSAIVRFAGEIPSSAPPGGFYVAPHIFEIAAVGDLKREIFGPVLHVVRYKAAELGRRGQPDLELLSELSFKAPQATNK